MIKRSKNRRLKLQVLTPFGTRTDYLTVEQVATIARCSHTTAYRWTNHPEKIPPATLELLQIKAIGLIPGDEFEGWTIHHGRLVSPLARNDGLTPAEVDNYLLTMQRVRHLQRRLIEESEKNRRMVRLLEDYRQRIPGAHIAANDED